MKKQPNIICDGARPFVQPRFPTTGYLAFLLNAPDEEALLGTIEASTYQEAMKAAEARWPQHGSDLFVNDAAWLAQMQAEMEYTMLQEQWSFAYDHAGRAVVASHFGWKVKEVSIRPRINSDGSRCDADRSAMGRLEFENKGNPASSVRRKCEEQSIIGRAGGCAIARFKEGPPRFDSWYYPQEKFVYCIDCDDCGEAYVEWLNDRSCSLVRDY